MQPSKKFAFDVGITFAASVVSMFIGFVITVLLGRYLGAGDLGLYRMVSTIYGIAMLFAAIGIPAAIIKYVAEFKDDRAKSDAIMSSGVITSLILGIVFSVLFYFLSGIFEGLFDMPRLSGLLKILSPVFPFALVGGALLGLLNGRREMKRYGTATIFQSVLMLVVSVSLIYCGFGVAGVVIGVVISSVGWCLYLLLITRDYFEITFEGYADNTKTMLGFGVQIFGANAINMINYQADIVMIGYFLTATDVGYYAVAVGLSKFFWLIPQAIQTITYPATSEYWANNNHSALQIMIDKSIKYTACVLLPIGLGVAFFAEDIITVIFGEGFVYAVLPLQILVVGTVGYGIAAKAIGGSTSAIGRPDINLKVVFVSAFVNIILNLLLIPRFGIIGAAVATTVSLSVVSIIFLMWCVKLFSLKIDWKWYKNVSMSVFLSILIFYVGQAFVEKYIIGFIILFSFIIIIYYILLNKEDRKYITSLI
jgi:O-antigen/teichoic acid export membrane protein